MSLFLLITIIVSGALGWLLFTGIFDVLTGYQKPEDDDTTFIDKSVHYHQHLNIYQDNEVRSESRHAEIDES